MRPPRPSILVIAFLATGCAPALAGSNARTAPGTYKDWGGDIDHLTVIQSFKAADYNRIVVMPIETAGVNLPDTDESTYGPVKDTLAKSSEIFAEGLKSKLTPKFSVQSGRPTTEAITGALVIRARVEKMNPGSRTGRVLGKGKLFHAMTDAAETRISGELADGATGKVLLRFTQQRRAGLGILGGAYEELLRRTVRDIGSDVGRILTAF